MDKNIAILLFVAENLTLSYHQQINVIYSTTGLGFQGR